MKLFKYISRENCLRLGLFLLLLSAAWVFDRYHDPVAKDQTETGHDQEKVVSTGLLCTLQSPLNLKAPGEKTVYPRADQEKWNRFLVRQLKARMSVLRLGAFPDRPTVSWTPDQLGKGIFYIDRELNDRFTTVLT